MEPTLALKNLSIGLRDNGDGTFSMKNEAVASKFVNGSVVPDSKRKEKSVGKRHKIESFSLVCTKELMKEAAILLFSLRMNHSEPVYIVADNESKTFLDSFKFINIFYTLTANPEDLEKIKLEIGDRFDNLKTFHRPECIYKKMEAMNVALEVNENTLLLDSDIIVVGNLQENFTGDICFSPHFHEDTEQDSSVGRYNAGYLFCANKAFPNWWKERFLLDSKFYEQECMNRAYKDFHLEIFGKSHNIGFWRSEFDFSAEQIKVQYGAKSFHIHLTDVIDDQVVSVIAEKVKKMRSCFRKYLIDKKLTDLSKFIDLILGGTDENIKEAKSIERVTKHKGNFPDFIVGGPAKSATSSLHSSLKRHSKLLCSESTKELHFFNSIDKYCQGMDFYESMLPAREPGSFIFETTPAYMCSPQVLARIHRNLPQIKMIYTVREPVSRFLSHYKHFRGVNEVKTNPVLKARFISENSWGEKALNMTPQWLGEKKLFSNIILQKQQSPTSFNNYFSQGEHITHIKNSIQVLGVESVKVVFFEDLISDPAKELGLIQDFIGIDREELILDQENGSELWAKYYDASPEITTEGVEFLKSYYTPYNQLLGSFLGRSLNW